MPQELLGVLSAELHSASTVDGFAPPTSRSNIDELVTITFVCDHVKTCRFKSQTFFVNAIVSILGRSPYCLVRIKSSKNDA